MENLELLLRNKEQAEAGEHKSKEQRKQGNFGRSKSQQVNAHKKSSQQGNNLNVVSKEATLAVTFGCSEV
jgi:hypothetical protein